MSKRIPQNLKWSFIIFLLVFGFSKSSFAQLGNIGSFISSGKADANTLANAYLNPLGRGFGAGLNSGWIISPTPHKKLGFDLSIRTGLALVPTSDQTFNVNALNLQHLQVSNGSSTESPTFSGPKSSGPTLNIQQQYNGNTYNLGSITLPSGTGFHFVPTPMLQAGVGLIAHTQITLRYLPKTNLHKYGEYQLFGFAIQHGLNQYIPGGKLLPVKFSIMVGYTDFKASDSNINITPSSNQSNTVNSYSSTEWNGQQIKSETKAYTINAIVGKNLPIIAVYGGLGYEAAKMTANTLGNYPIVVPDPTTNNPTQKKVEALTDPINLSIKDSNSFRAFVGFKLKLTVFYISANYTISKYSVASAGFGLNFR